jgi:hypothetical protein
VTTVRGTIRSTERQESEGSGHDIPSARDAAIAGLDLDHLQLRQANTVTSKATGETTTLAVAQATELRDHEATGPTYEAALEAFRSSIPEGWQAQYFVVID